MMEVSEMFFPNCPVRNVLARVGDKWSLLVLNALQRHTGPMRFGELRKALPDASSKILTSTLRNLEADGLWGREVFAEVPPRVEYSLTDRALSFIAACRPMIQWAIDNLPAILSDRRASELKR